MTKTVLLLSVVIMGCQGQDLTQVTECVVEQHAIYLAHGDSCELTAMQVERYSIEPSRASSGLLMCDDGELTLNDKRFASGDIVGQVFQGLSLFCENQ